MRGKIRFSLLAVLMVLTFSTQFSLSLYAQCNLSQGCGPVDNLTGKPNGTGQVYQGDGASSNGSGGWSTSQAGPNQCLSCHNDGTVASYLMSGHKNTLRKIAPGVLWAGPDGAPYSTTDDHYGSGSVYNWSTGTITLGWCDPLSVPALLGRTAHDPTCSYPYYTLPNGQSPATYTPVAPTAAAGGQQNLLYMLGGWEHYGGSSNPGNTHIGTIFTNGFTGGLYPNGNFDCARCHTTGYNFDASAPEPTQNTNNVVTPIPDAQFSRIPSDGYIAPGTNGTSSWYLSGIQCERCHDAAWSYGNHGSGPWQASMPQNEAATALCMECHRGETVTKANPNTIPPTQGSVTPQATPKTQDKGYCSDLSGSTYAACISNSATWVYKPYFEHEAGTFLNSPHARFTGNLVQNAQHSPDLSVSIAGTYKSLFSANPTDQTKNNGCTGCHDPHQSVSPSTKLPEPFVCNDCHSLSNNIMQTVNHPMGIGTPFPTGTAADIPGACVTCHMVAADGNVKSHLFRISTTDYTTFPTPDQLYNQNITAPNFAPDGVMNNAAWNDVDLACGQCHTGGNGVQNPYGLTPPPQTGGLAPRFTKYQLETYAATMHPGDSQASAPTFTPAGGAFNAAQSVTLTETTPSTTVYYNVDGTTPPNQTSIEYTGTPIAVTANTTIRAVAVGVGGWATGRVATANYSFQTATPTLSPAGGTYTTPQSVTLSDATPNVTYYYTTDGTTPTTSSTQYSGSIAMSTPGTIKAIAVSSFGSSTAVSGIFNFSYPQAAPPTMSPSPIGTFSSTQTVTLKDSSPGVTIYYTTNGTTPTASSTPYTGSIQVSSTTTIEAIAIGSGYSPSNLAVGTFTIVPATPSFSPRPIGSFSTVQSVTLSDTTAGVTIYYTTDGSDPATSSTRLVYSTPISVTTTTTINAIAVAGSSQSSAASGTYNLVAATPTFAPKPIGSFSTPQSVTLSDNTPGVSYYYTTNGTTPTTGSTPYTGAILVSSTTTIEAIAVGNGFAASQPASGTFTITTGNLVTSNNPITSITPGSNSDTGGGTGYAPSPVATGNYNLVAAAPAFSPEPKGIFTEPPSVTLTDATPGATIYYTTNGTPPTTDSARYTGPIPVSTTTTIKALAAGKDFGPSSVVTGTYILVAATPVFSPEPKGTFSSPLMVTLRDATPGVTIYYTTNGASPTTSSTPYTKPIRVTGSMTIKAIAAGNGYGASSVAGGSYGHPVRPTQPRKPGRTAGTNMAVVTAK